MVNARIEIDQFDEKGDLSLWKKRMLVLLSVFGLKDVLEESSPLFASVIKKDENEKCIHGAIGKRGSWKT